MTDIAKVGFGVDTSGPEKLSGALDNTKKSVDNLSQSMDKSAASSATAAAGLEKLQSTANATNTSLAGTTTALTNNFDAAGKYLGPLTAIEQAAARSGVSVDQFNQRTLATKAALIDSNAAAAESTGILSSLAATLGLTGGAMADQGAKTHASAQEHTAHSAATRELREGVHVLAPELEALGLKMQGLTQFTYASRAGILAFAAAVAGTVVIDMAKADDVIETTRVRLEGLAGVKLGTKLHDGLVDLSGDLGKVAFSMEPALESIVKLQQELGSGSGSSIFSTSLENARVNADGAKAAIGTLFEQLRMGGASETEAATGINKFFETVQKEGGITGNALRDLGKVAPQAVADIVNAITHGTTSVTQFEQELDKVPLSIGGLISVLIRMKTATDETFQKWSEDPKTVAESVNLLKGSFEDLWKAISGGNDFSTSVINSLKAVGTTMDEIRVSLPGLKDQFDATKAAAMSWGDTIKIVSDDNSIFGRTIEINIIPIIIKMGQAFWGVSTTINEVVDGAIAKLNSLSDAAIRIAQTVAGAIAKMFSASSGGGSGGSQGPDSQQVGGGSSDSGSTAGPGGAPISGDAGTVNLGDLGGGTGGATDNVPSFASGGGFTVGGDGGTDTTLVQFMATRGEQVDIYHGDKSAGANDNIASAAWGGPSAGAIQSDIISSRFSRIISDQTVALDDQLNTTADKIVAAINNLDVSLSRLNATASGATSTTTPSTTTAAVAAASGLSAVTGGGAGGFKTQSGGGLGEQAAKDEKAALAQLAKDQAAADAADRQLAASLARSGGATAQPRTTTSKSQPAQPSDYGQTGSGAPLDANGNPISSSAFVTDVSGSSSISGFSLSGIGTTAVPAGSGLPIGFDNSGFAPVDNTDAFRSQQQNDLSTTLKDSNQTLGDIHETTQQTNTAIGEGTQQTVSSVDNAASTIADAVTSSNQNVVNQLGNLGPTIAQLQGSEFANIEASLGGGGASGGGGGTISRPSGGGGGFGGGVTGGVTGGGAFNPATATQAQILAYNYGSGYGPANGVSYGLSDSPAGIGIGQTYTPPQNLGNENQVSGASENQVVSSGSFAVGGSFVVGGDGGTDTTPVHFFATKGERVTIASGGANDNAIPGNASTYAPPWGGTPPRGEAVSVWPVDQRTSGSDTQRPVQIVVSPGLQADDFIRSRAQVQRALR